MPAAKFQNRTEAGRILAEGIRTQLGESLDDHVVLALPRGGVPVAAEMADRLGAPMDILVVRKMGVPGQEELAMGAVAEGGHRILNHDIVQILRIPHDVIDAAAKKEGREIAKRCKAYRQDRAPVSIEGKAVILVDDGLATGASMRAAIRAAYAQGASHCIVATPVGAVHTCMALLKEADEVICMEMPEPFNSVGEWYEDFSQVTDEEVQDLVGRYQPAHR